MSWARVRRREGRRRIVDRTVMLDAVLSTYAPPACVFLHARQPQMPTATRFMANLPQKPQK